MVHTSSCCLRFARRILYFHHMHKCVSFLFSDILLLSKNMQVSWLAMLYIYAWLTIHHEQVNVPTKDKGLCRTQFYLWSVGLNLHVQFTCYITCWTALSHIFQMWSPITHIITCEIISMFYFNTKIIIIMKHHKQARRMWTVIQKSLFYTSSERTSAA